MPSEEGIHYKSGNLVIIGDFVIGELTNSELNEDMRRVKSGILFEQIKPIFD